MNLDRSHKHDDGLDPRNGRERLSSYLDGEMSPDDARRFLNWLEANPAALKDAEEARRVWALLSAYADEPVPEGFAERVLAKTTGSHAVSFPDAVAERAPAWPISPMKLLSGGRSRAIAAAAAVLIAVGAGVVVSQRGTGPASDSSASAGLEAVPAELLESDNLTSLASLSDEEFDAILSADPETLTADASKDQGG